MSRGAVPELLVPLLLMLGAGLGHAQTQLSCNITEVKVEQLSNAVEIRLHADGLLNVEVQPDDFIDPADGWSGRWRNDIPVRITNARSVIGTFADISRYPVYYLEMLTPAESREGVGLNVRVVLFANATFRSIDVDNLSETRWYSARNVAFDVRKSPSRRDLVITVWSDRREEVRDQPKPRREAGLPVSLSVEPARDGLIAVDAVNAPLEQLMARVAEVAGVPVLVDDRVKRLATVHLPPSTVERIVGAVANGYGLTAAQQGGVWTISDGLPSSMAPYVAGETRIFPLRYLTAAQAMELLPNFLVYYVKPTASGEALAAHGPGQLLDRISADLAALDQPVRMVALRAAVVEATDSTASERLWRLLRGGRTRVRIDPDAGALAIGHGDRTLERYVAAVRALRTRGRVRVQVHPTIVVQPGAWGEIFVGAKQYYQFVSDTWWGDSMVLEAADAGVRLRCRPRAMGSGMFEVRVEVSVSTLRNLTRDLPVVDLRSALGTLRVRSGDTMIVGGGLVLDQGQQEQRGPWERVPTGALAQLPEAARRDQQMREIVFLVSAEIVEGRPAVPANLPLQSGEEQ